MNYLLAVKYFAGQLLYSVVARSEEPAGARREISIGLEKSHQIKALAVTDNT